VFDPDAGMPRLNRSLVCLGACIIAGLRLARERQVNIRVVPTRAAAGRLLGLDTHWPKKQKTYLISKGLKLKKFTESTIVSTN